MKDKDFFCNLTALFWRYYILEPTKEHFEELLSYFSDELIMIGTGKHEFYTNVIQILDSMKDNQVEAETIPFQVLDEWYECLKVSQDVFLVYGGIWVRQKGQPEDETLIEMDTRFSVLYRKQGDKCEVLHIHHSIPFVEQQPGEYYPKTLIEKAKAAMDLTELFKQRSEMDLMTKIYNNVSFKHQVMLRMETCSNGNLYLFDLDHFKSVNDTYGHATGDSLLKLFSNLLKNTFDSDAIIGRVGGDEFAVFEFAPLEKGLIIQKITQMQERFDSIAREILSRSTTGFSVGIASMTRNKQMYEDLFENTDNSLYQAKQLGRKTYYWHNDSPVR